MDYRIRQKLSLNSKS